MWIQGNRAKKSQLRRKDQQAVPIWAQVGARAKDAPPGWRVRGATSFARQVNRGLRVLGRARCAW